MKTCNCLFYMMIGASIALIYKKYEKEIEDKIEGCLEKK